jgi:hypothetical protein
LPPGPRHDDITVMVVELAQEKAGAMSLGGFSGGFH